MSKKNRFHPIALPTYFLKFFGGFLFLFILVILNLGENPVFAIILSGAILVLCSCLALLKYFTHTYSIDDNKIVVYSGVFIKRETEIPYERIQTIKQKQWFFYKPFNIVQIFIETGSTADNEAEASLMAVDKSLIDLIENYRFQRKNLYQADSFDKASSLYKTKPRTDMLGDDLFDDDAREDEEIIYQYKLSYKEIFFYALTDFNVIIVAFSALFLIGELIFEVSFEKVWLQDNFFENIRSLLPQRDWIALLSLGISSIGLLLVFSMFKNFIYYFDFTVTCRRKTITIEHGIFERKTQKIPLAKVQGIQIYQQAVRKILSMASVEVLLIGGHEENRQKNADSKLLILPLIKTKDMYPALAKLFPNYSIEDPTINYVSRGKLFYFWRWKLLFMIPLLTLGFYLHTGVGTGILLVSIIILAFNWLDSRYQGYEILDKNLIVIQKFRGISKIQTYLNKTKIQSFDKSTSLLLMRKKIGHFMFWIKSGLIPMPVGLNFLDNKDIDNIQKFLVNKK